MDAAAYQHELELEEQYRRGLIEKPIEICNNCRHETTKLSTTCTCIHEIN